MLPDSQSVSMKKKDSNVRTPSSPLSPLRLSSSVDMAPGNGSNGVQNEPITPSIKAEGKKKSPKRNGSGKKYGTILSVNGKPILFRKPLKNGFDLDLNFSSFKNSENSEEDMKHDEGTEVRENHVNNRDEGDKKIEEVKGISNNELEIENNPNSTEVQDPLPKGNDSIMQLQIPQIEISKTSESVDEKEEKDEKDTIEEVKSNEEIEDSSQPSQDNDALSPLSKDNLSRAQRASQLTSILLDTRRSLQTDCNVVDPLKADPSHRDIYTENNTKISRSTIARAEKVKAMLGVKYLYIQRIYDWSMTNRDSNQHPGVEGVYNPLQILRNRKIRAKYHEYPKPLSMKTIPLACNVFSKNNKDPKNPWRMLWAVELTEVVSDISWRNDHWHELKTPMGKLWFPPSASGSSSDISTKDHLKRRFHDKLFNDDDEIAAEKDKGRKREKDNKYHNRRTSVATTASSDSDHIFKISRARSPHKKIGTKVKKRAKKLYNTSSSSNSTEDDIVEADRVSNGNLDILKQQMFKKVSLSPDELSEEEALEISPASRLPDSATLIPTPSIKVEDTRQEYDINDVQFSSMDKREFEQRETQVESQKRKACISIDRRDQELAVILADFSYFQQVINLRTAYLLKIYPNFTGSVRSKLNGIIYNQLHELFHVTTSISDDHLPEYEDLYHGFFNEVKSIVHMINDDFSVKIDNLLSNSDRSISEINASLSLELRKINERLDKLNSSLFSNIVTETLKDDEVTMKIRDGTNHKIMYFLLENIIVVSLRFIWVIVNIYKVFEKVVKLVWKFISLLFF